MTSAVIFANNTIVKSLLYNEHKRQRSDRSKELPLSSVGSLWKSVGISFRASNIDIVVTWLVLTGGGSFDFGDESPSLKTLGYRFKVSFIEIVVSFLCVELILSTLDIVSSKVSRRLS